jgi:hypothetical protein
MEPTLLLQLKRIQLQMLQTRGYLISPEESPFLIHPLEDPDDINAAINIPLDTIEGGYTQRKLAYTNLLANFIATYKIERANVSPSVLTKSYTSPSIEGEVYVFYTPPARIVGGKKKADGDAFKQLTELLKSPANLKRYNKLIVITEVIPAAQQMTQLYELKSLHTEVFLYNELLVNPTSHFLSEPVSVGKVPEGIKKEQLPRILEDNIIAKFHGHSSGDVLKFDRQPIVASGFPSLPAYRVVK